MNLRKHLYHYNYLSLDYDDVTSLNTQYIQRFAKDFQKYLKTTPKEVQTKPKIHHDKVIKALYRKLSIVTHPDKSGSDTEFKKANELYQNDDLIGIINSCVENDVEIDEKEIEGAEEQILTNIKIFVEKIDKIKNALPWLWATGSKETKEAVSRQVRGEVTIAQPKPVRPKLPKSTGWKPLS